jgi:hypothetical protein
LSGKDDSNVIQKLQSDIADLKQMMLTMMQQQQQQATTNVNN